MMIDRPTLFFRGLFALLATAVFTLSACAAPATETAVPSIPAHRAGDFTLHIVDARGNPIPRADVTVRQTRHEFIFGGQIPDCRPVPADKRW